MKNIILSRDKDPLGEMLLDFLDGNQTAAIHVESSNLDMWEMSAQVMFRRYKQMNRIERKALSLCRGDILDAGAGSGCHSLYLQKRHPKVHAIDISPGCVGAMKQQKIRHVTHTNLFALEKNKRYDTILMLMNGIGICGTIDGLNLFFQFIRTILKPGGQVIADSTDLSTFYSSTISENHTDDYHGQTEFFMTYKTIQSDPFPWIYIDFDTLTYYANFHGLSCKKIMTDATGKYLVCMEIF